MSNSIYIIGSGGHLHSLISIINHYGYKICGIYDKSFNKDIPEKVCGNLIVGTTSQINKYDKLILAVGNNTERNIFYNTYLNNVEIDNLLHPLARIEEKVRMGRSNQIFGNSFINGYCKIGENNIINSGSIIEHEVIIGNHNHISIGTVISGRVHIGDFCFIGAGSVIIDKIKITNNVIIGANSVVIRDITESGTYVGNPAKKIK